MPQKIKTILFDFDGTLADTLPICIRGIGEAFHKYDDRQLTSSDIISMFGPTEADIIRFNLVNRDSAEQAVEMFFDYYTREHNQMVKPDERMIQLLRKLQAEGYRMGIVTGKGRATLDISLSCLDMAHFFEVTITGDEVTRPKPDPEGVLKALRTLDSNPEEAVFIGDSEADMRAGKGAGVFTIGAHWLEHIQTPKFDTKPDLYVTRTEEFLDWLSSH